jgi:hypothetical protein
VRARDRKYFWQSVSVGPTHTLARGQSCSPRDVRTGGKIQTHIAENKSPELSHKDIVSKHVWESVQNLIGNLCGGGRKRARGVARKKAIRDRVIKRDIF